MQIRAPSSIVAWLNVAASPGGGASAPARAKTRRAFVSIATTWCPKAKEPTAAAV